MVELSVVIPVYQCAECLTVLYERLIASLESSVDSFEIVFVDDRSPDDSWQILSGLAQRDLRVRAVRLSRNFGQHAAITAGLAESRGRWTVVMDCDLQDPPGGDPAPARQGGGGLRDRPLQAGQASTVPAPSACEPSLLPDQELLHADGHGYRVQHA